MIFLRLVTILINGRETGNKLVAAVGDMLKVTQILPKKGAQGAPAGNRAKLKNDFIREGV
jgi:hypothetical protein